MRQVTMRLYCLAACAALVPPGCGEAKQAAPAAAPPRAVQVLTLAPAPIRTTADYLGSLLSRGSVNVLPQVAGYVRAIHVQPGQRVEAGLALVEIDAREENAALSSAAAGVQSAIAQRELAKQTLSRTEALHREGLATAQEVDQRRADHAAAAAAVTAATAQVSQRRVALSNRTIRSAIPGVVGDVNVRIGDYVTATTTLTSIAKADALELSVSVPAARARELALGAPLEVLGDDGAVLVASTVSYVGPEADPRTQLVELKASFDNTVELRPRELVRVRIVYATRDALVVPLLAVQRQAGRAFVFVVTAKAKDSKDLVVQRRLVQLGPLREQGYVVAGGLTAGERIAVSSLHALKDGAAVTLQTPVAGTPAKQGS